MRGISRLVEDMLAFQEGLSSMELAGCLVGWLVSYLVQTSPRYQMELCGHFHSLTVLSPRNEPTIRS